MKTTIPSNLCLQLLFINYSWHKYIGLNCPQNAKQVTQNLMRGKLIHFYFQYFKHNMLLILRHDGIALVISRSLAIVWTWYLVICSIIKWSTRNNITIMHNYFYTCSSFSDINCSAKVVYFLFSRCCLDRRGGVEVERSPRVREIGVRSPVATDLNRKNR